MFKLILILYLVKISICDWVEIPQFTKKSYMVTPYTPYIYEKTTYFTTTSTSTTPRYFESTARQPLEQTNPEVYVYAEQKKSITKVPDHIIKHVSLTTEIPAIEKNRLKPPHTRNNKPKNGTKTNRNRYVEKFRNNNKTIDTTLPPKTNNWKHLLKSTTTNPPQFKGSQVFLDEQEYEEELIYNDDEEYEDEIDGDTDGETDGEGEYEDEAEDAEDDYYEDDDEYEEEKIEKVKTKGDDTGYSYVGLLPYLKSIQSTLIRNSHKTTKSKVSFLTEIKDRLLYAIKDKISSIWSGRSRQARSTREDYHSPSWDKGDSGMAFPSNEGALLTIGFLTFAVFLIKCILKLIQAIKGKSKGNKNVIVVPIVTTVTTVAPATRRLIERSITDEDSISILNLLDSYKYQ